MTTTTTTTTCSIPQNNNPCLIKDCKFQGGFLHAPTTEFTSTFNHAQQTQLNEILPATLNKLNELYMFQQYEKTFKLTCLALPAAVSMDEFIFKLQALQFLGLCKIYSKIL